MVGNWWFEPDECGCCTSSTTGSFIRTFTTSFGSICFGAFVVAVIQALRMLANSAQSNGDAQFIACIAECLLACLASPSASLACHVSFFAFSSVLAVIFFLARYSCVFPQDFHPGR